jgi:hypothetical protein
MDGHIFALRALKIKKFSGIFNLVGFSGQKLARLLANFCIKFKSSLISVSSLKARPLAFFLKARPLAFFLKARPLAFLLCPSLPARFFIMPKFAPVCPAQVQCSMFNVQCSICPYLPPINIQSGQYGSSGAKLREGNNE